MTKPSKSGESEGAKLLNNRNMLYKGIMARAVVQQNEGAVVLPYTPSKSPGSEVTLIGCDADVGDLDTFGVIITVTKICYDTDTNQPSIFVADVDGQFSPTEDEIVAAYEGESALDDKTKLNDETDSDEPDSSSQSDSDTSDASSAPSGRSDGPSTQSGKMMRDLLGKGKP